MKFFEKIKCRKILKSQVSKLVELRHIITGYRNVPTDVSECLNLIVKFLNEMSSFLDRSDIDLAIEHNMFLHYPEIYKNLVTIVTCDFRCGRDLFGWNRTKCGEQVTVENVYLGNVFGLNTYPVSYWLAAPVSQTHPYIKSKVDNKPMWVSQVICELQIRPFIEERLEMITTIEEVLRQIEKI